MYPDKGFKNKICSGVNKTTYCNQSSGVNKMCTGWILIQGHVLVTLDSDLEVSSFLLHDINFIK